jgi:hypothetical protein
MDLQIINAYSPALKTINCLFFSFIRHFVLSK